MFAEGGFRWESGIQVLLPLSVVTTGVQSFIAMDTPSGERPDSGTVYVSPRYRFTLEVPRGWHTNDAVASAPFGIGAFTSPDEQVNLLIQQMPGAQDPADFVKKLDARGDRMFAGYHKISEYQMLLEGTAKPLSSSTLTHGKLRKAHPSQCYSILGWSSSLFKRRFSSSILSRFRRGSTLSRTPSARSSCHTTRPRRKVPPRRPKLS